MNIEVIIQDYQCPSCQKQFGFRDKIEFEEYDTESIWDDDKMTCECGAEFQIDVECDVSVKLISAPKVPQNLPIDDATGLPDVIAENQLPLFNQ
jgi:hypothetical protein